MLARMFLRMSGSAAAVVCLWVAGSTTATAEAYLRVPTPPGIHVEQTLQDGPVFADSRGRTLYRWGLQEPGSARIPTCESTVAVRGTARRIGEVILPVGKACAEMWPAHLAPADAKPIGDWSPITRKDGSTQWAHKDYPIYTFYLDAAPGEVKGGTNRIPQYNWSSRAATTYRVPLSPPPDVPPGFQVLTTPMGRQLLVGDQHSLYILDDKASGAKSCSAECALNYEPVLAPVFAESAGEWSTVEIAAGMRQWAYRGKPLFTYKADNRHRSLDGADVPGWKAVFVQEPPPLPAGFSVQDTSLGPAIADRQAKTVYIFHCFDASPQRLPCDTTDNTQVYRLALCGLGDPDLCMRTWPYVLASDNDQTLNWVWSVININPQTGDISRPGEPSLRVWAYRARPLYNFSRDRVSGDIMGDGAGAQTGGGPGFEKIAMRSDLNAGAGAD